MKLEEILSGTADGLCAVDIDGKIVLWNQAAEKILGYTARDAIGRPCCDLFDGHDTTGNKLCYPGCQVLNLVKMGEKVEHFDIATRTRSGRPVWLDVSILMVPSAKKDRPTTVHLFRDVTVSRNRDLLLTERMGRMPQPTVPTEELSTLLTRREMETLRLLTAGIGTKAMAARFHVSPSTIRNHVQNILNKLGVHSRLEAVARATAHGLTPPAIPKS